MSEITVWVTEFADRRHYQLQWVDPATGRKRTKSSGVERTGLARDRKKAEKAAGDYAAKLNAGMVDSDITWAAFRERYEEHGVMGLATNTAAKIRTVFNGLERILPKVAKGKLKDLTAERITHYQNGLRKLGRSEDTIAGHCAHLRASLAWAKDQGLLGAVPIIRRPKRAKKVKGTSPMKGRPITGEEFERMLAAVPKAVLPNRPEGVEVTAEEREADAKAVAVWKHYLRGLWWSGLRLEESLHLYWDRPDQLCLDMDGKHPMLRIPAEMEKGHRDRLLPLAPEFAEFLLETPEDQRRGRVFRLFSYRYKTSRLTKDRVSRIVGKIGEQAKVKVQVKAIKDRETGESVQRVKYASAHDLRRSFGERWASRVMPPVLQELMRHENIQTTLRYYVGRNAERTAETVWEAYQGQNGNTFGNTRGDTPSFADAADAT